MAHNSGLTNAYCKAWFEDNQGNCTSPDTLSLGRFVPAPSPKKQKSGESLTLARSFSPCLGSCTDESVKLHYYLSPN